MRRLAAGRTLVAICVVLAMAGLWFAAGRYEIVQAVDDRLSVSYSIGQAQFVPPNLVQWPRLTEDGARARCDICFGFGDSKSDIFAEYGVLVSDDALNDLGNAGPAHPPSAASVPLPRIVWILQWQPTCYEVVVRHSPKCATYELIDDATGWILDVGQVLLP